MVIGRALIRSAGIASEAQKLLQRKTATNLKCLLSTHTMPATYGGRHTVTLIPADGIGPALIDGMCEVFGSAGVPVDFEVADITGETQEEVNASFNEVLMAVRRNGVAIKGNWAGRLGQANLSLNVALRHELDLYANVVHCKSVPNIITRHDNVDLVIVRENTEGEYSNLEHENVPGVIEMLKVVTEEKAQRIARFAFEYAKSSGRKKVTSIHKANIMKISDGLFLNTCREVSKEYPDIEFGDMIIDNCAMQLVSKPEQFDVMVMPNLYGNVITNIAAGLIGGPGIPSGANHGDDKHVYESGTRNSGQGIAHLNIANPMSIISASTSMLRFLGLQHQAETIDHCMESIVSSNKARTQDIGGTTSTTDFYKILMEEIELLRQYRMRELKYVKRNLNPSYITP